MNSPSTVLRLSLRGSPVSLPAILEPIRHLRQRESSLFGERALLIGCRVAIDTVAVLEGSARLLLKAVDGLFSIPDGFGQREFAT